MLQNLEGRPLNAMYLKNLKSSNLENGAYEESILCEVIMICIGEFCFFAKEHSSDLYAQLLPVVIPVFFLYTWRIQKLRVTT